MSNHPFLHAAVLGVALAASASPAGAQTLSPAPKLGLWETQASVLVNGKDVMAGVRKMQEEMLKQLPPAQRQQMAAMMGSQAGAMAGGKTQQCVVAADAARFTRPDQAMAEMQRNAPRCRFEQPVVKGSNLDFKGRCTDAEGFTGDMVGSFTMDSPTAWHGVLNGKGRVPNAEAIPGLKAGPDGLFDMRIETQSKWVSADCGSVKSLSTTR